MALEIDLSTATVVSSDITPINEVVDTPATQATPPLDLPDTTVIAQGFLAGTIDGSISGLGGIVGSGLNAAGFFGINDEHKLTYFLGSQSFDYSSSAFSELGQVEAGELRIGDDVSADRYGALTGDSYLRYVPSTGLRIHNSAVTISGPSGSIWVGDVQADGTPDTTGSGCGILDIGYYAINSGTPTFRLLNSGDLFAIGNDVSQDTVTHKFLGTKYLAYTDDRGLEIQGGSVSVNNSGFVWVGGDLGAYVRGETTVLPDGVGLVHNLDINGTIINGIAAIYGQEAKFSVNGDTGDVYLVDGTINIGSQGYIWIGDWTSSLEPDFTKSGVGIWRSGLGGLSNGAVTFFIDKTSGHFAFGQNVDMNTVTTTKGLYFDGSNVNLANIDLINKSGGVTTVEITSAGDLTLGSDTAHQLKYTAADGNLTIDGANIGVANSSYIWVGASDLSHGCGLTGGLAGWTDGFYASHSSVCTVFISAVDGSFHFGELSGPHISYDGANLDLIDLSDVWVGNADHSTGVGLRNTSTESGFYARNAGAQTIFIDASNGDLTLGTPASHQLTYVSETGVLAIDGAQVGINNNAYVWVGASDFSTGCGMVGGGNPNWYGFYCGYNGDVTVHISAVDGSFTFGKTSGSHIHYDGTNLALFDTNITVRNATNDTTVSINADDGSFKFGTTDHCIEFNGTDTLNLTGINTVLSSGNYVWVGTPTSQGCGICDIGIYGTDSSGNQTVLIRADDGSFQLGSTYYLAMSASGKLTLKISDYATDFVATNAPEANATVGARAGDNVFASSGSVLHDGDIITSQGTANNAQNYTGNSIQTVFTDAKCTDPYADQTSANTAYNTSHVNGATTTGGNSYVVSNGDIKMYNSGDINFYQSAGTNLKGAIEANSHGLIVKYVTDSQGMSGGFTEGGLNLMSVSHIGMMARGIIELSATQTIDIDATVKPESTSVNLGSSSYKFGTVYANYLGSSSYKINTLYTTYIGTSSAKVSYIYANYIGSSSYKVSTVYATSIGQYNSKTSYVYTNSLGHSSYRTNYMYASHLNINTNNITVGSSSSYFKIHIYNGGWASYPCYITQS